MQHVIFIFLPEAACIHMHMSDTACNIHMLLPDAVCNIHMILSDAAY